MNEPMEDEEKEEQEETNDKYMRVCQQSCMDHNYLKLLKHTFEIMSLIHAAQCLSRD